MAFSWGTSVYKSNIAIMCVYFFSLSILFVFVSRAICMLTLCRCQYEALVAMSIHSIEIIWKQRSSIFPLLNIFYTSQASEKYVPLKNIEKVFSSEKIFSSYIL